MCPCDEEMTLTPKLSDKKERISLEDLVWTEVHLNDLMRMAHCRTYAFHITSDTQLRTGRHIV